MKLWLVLPVHLPLVFCEEEETSGGTLKNCGFGWEDLAGAESEDQFLNRMADWKNKDFLRTERKKKIKKSEEEGHEKSEELFEKSEWDVPAAV